MEATPTIRDIVLSKIKAALIHGVVTLLVAILSAFIVFKVWYPDGLAYLIGGAELFLLIVGVELCLGPLMSLVIYNRNKPLSELTRDYAIVGLIQLAAVIYGLHSTYVSRPVFMVFAVDRIEVISAVELTAKDIQSATDKRFTRLSLTGPIEVCVSKPDDPQERSDLLLSALAGKDIELMPKYYRECDAGEVRQAAADSSLLIDLLEEKQAAEDLNRLQQLGGFAWLPVKSRFGSWVKIFPHQKDQKSFYLKHDPFIH